jgi:integrase
VFKKAKYVPTPLEVNHIRMAAAGEYRLYLEILIETAARPGECRSLAWEDVRFDSPFSVVLYTRKTAGGSEKPRRLEISRDLAKRFRSWRKAQGPGKLYVFQQEDADLPRVPMWEVKNQRKCCKAGEVDYFPPGCFRHYTASRWAAEGLTLPDVQRKLGHSQATTTNNYLHEITRT